jgi:hypothetical protein
MLDGQPNPNIVSASSWDNLAHVILNSKPLVSLWEILALNVAPTIIAFLFVFGVIPTLGDRLVFQLESYFGGVCQKTASTLPTPGETWSLEKPFAANNPCMTTGFKLSKGQDYEVTFKINSNKPWQDDGSEADLSGLKWSTIAPWKKTYYAFVGPMFRRVYTEPWFKPILRVGDGGITEIAAEPSTPFANDSAKQEMLVKFRSPRDGELFVFVNDAYPGIFPLAWLLGRSAENVDGSWRHAYGDNTGSATLSIRRGHSAD